MWTIRWSTRARRVSYLSWRWTEKRSQTQLSSSNSWGRSSTQTSTLASHQTRNSSPTPIYPWSRTTSHGKLPLPSWLIKIIGSHHNSSCICSQLLRFRVLMGGYVNLGRFIFSSAWSIILPNCYWLPLDIQFLPTQSTTQSQHVLFVVNFFV